MKVKLTQVIVTPDGVTSIVNIFNRVKSISYFCEAGINTVTIKFGKKSVCTLMYDRLQLEYLD